MLTTWILLAGLASAPLSAQVVPTAAPATPAADPRAGAAVGSEYIIGPGDSLQVFIWRNAELSVTVPVRPDGKISTPLVEDMVAVGKTPSQLARDIEAVLAAYIRTPQVNVIVTNAVSTFSQVRVLGQVTTPQAVPYREGMTVLDAILAVGGLGEFAAGNRGKIVRVVNGKSQDIKVRIEDLVNDGDVTQNLPLKPGDVLVVPESRF
ncbi:MAG: polysaccharide export protein [Steroidobacteraceae bacterium]|nr:polysaccharide export protein [Steroidobacteraceae bacterium]